MLNRENERLFIKYHLVLHLKLKQTWKSIEKYSAQVKVVPMVRISTYSLLGDVSGHFRIHLGGEVTGLISLCNPWEDEGRIKQTFLQNIG